MMTQEAIVWSILPGDGDGSLKLPRFVQALEGLDVGHRVRVQLVHTDVERGFIDFRRVS